MFDHLPTVVALIAVASALIGVTAFGWRVIKRLDAITEGVLGKTAVTDRSGAVIEPAVPSLQARVGALEALMSNDSQESRISALEVWREVHTREATDVAQRLLDHITNHADGK